MPSVADYNHDHDYDPKSESSQAYPQWSSMKLDQNLITLFPKTKAFWSNNYQQIK